jgi:hypothetical protein
MLVTSRGTTISVNKITTHTIFFNSTQLLKPIGTEKKMSAMEFKVWMKRNRIFAKSFENEKLEWTHKKGYIHHETKEMKL